MVSITRYYGSILWTDFGTNLDVSSTVNINTFNTPNEYIAIVNTKWELNDSISKMCYPVLLDFWRSIKLNLDFVPYIHAN